MQSAVWAWAVSMALRVEQTGARLTVFNFVLDQGIGWIDVWSAMSDKARLVSCPAEFLQSELDRHFAN